MKYNLSKYKFLLLAVWGVLLLTFPVGCDKEKIVEESNIAIYRVNGTVVDANGTPVAGIGQGCWDLYEDENQYVYYCDPTDSTGRFVMEHIEGTPMDTTIAIALSDMDGDTNGLFADTVVVVRFFKSELHGGGEGVYGEAEKDITIVLRSANNY